MIRQTPGTFRVANDPIQTNCLNDQFSATPVIGSCQWTQGSTLLDPLNIFTGITSDRAKIISFTVAGNLLLMRPLVGGDQASPPFGKLGRIIAGITSKQGPSGPAGGFNPLQPLPSDLSLVGDLWNPANDPLPPQAESRTTTPANNLQVGITNTLAQPLPIPAGGAGLCIGIWMLPSLISVSSPDSLATAVLWLYGSTWSLTYDDGQ